MRTAVALAALALLTACTSSPSTGTRATAPAAPTSRSAVPTSTTPSTSASTSGTVWLCRPGATPDPCTADESSTTVTSSGRRTREASRPAAMPPIDCFYVYPTVSNQKTVNADLHIDPEEIAVAKAQASRFSADCRVFAPMYPQLTRSAIGGTVSATGAIVAYGGVLRAWQDYLANDNHGRGVVLIGHSQGAFLLTALIRLVIDNNPVIRKRIVSAILLGGNVTVPKGKTVGGDFTHLPACTSGHQSGCVVAYSSFAGPPPNNSLFGRAGTGFGVGLGGAPTAGMQVLCTNPAELDGNRGRLRPYLPTTAFPGLSGGTLVPPGLTTPWVGLPGRFTATCRTAGGATWLQINGSAKDLPPSLTRTLGPRWGLHVVDVNIALGNLVALVRAQATAYRR